MKRFTLSAAALIAMLSVTQGIVAQGTESTQQTTTVAQQNDKKMSLSLQDAINYALEHNRQLKNASLDVQKAEMQRWQAIAQMLPQIDGTFQYTNMFNQEMELMGQKMKMNPYGQMTFQAVAGVSAQGIIGAQMQRIQKEIANINVLKSEQETKYDVETLYTTILAYEEIVRLLESNVESLNNLKTMTENAVKAGTVEQNEANQISVQVASLKSNINKTKRQTEAYYNSLILLLGASSDSEIELSQKLDDIVNASTIIDLVNSNLDLNQNFDYQMLTKKSEITDKQKQMAVAAFFPNVSVALQNTHKHYFTDGTNFDMTPTNTFVATLSVPIFSSGKRTCAVKEAKIAQIEQANTVEDTEIGLKIQEKQLKYNLTSAYENYTVQKENINVMSSLFNSYGEKFKYGRASSMDVTNSSMNLDNANREYIGSVLEMVTANIELKKLLNK